MEQNKDEVYRLESSPDIVLALGSMSLDNLQNVYDDLLTEVEKTAQDIGRLRDAIESRIYNR